jgi:sporulation protein YlmC with PRC-barrel domain
MTMNRFLASTALAASLGLSAASYAQTSGTQQSPTPSQRVQSGASVLLQETPDDYLAHQDLIGTSIRNTQNDTIGEVEDLVVEKSGRLKGVVVGVGGFLGIGEKHVALAWNEIQMREPERSGAVTRARHPLMVVNVTKDQLRQAPEFKRVTDVRRDGTRSMSPSGAPATSSPGTSPPPRQQ